METMVIAKAIPFRKGRPVVAACFALAAALLVWPGASFGADYRREDEALKAAMAGAAAVREHRIVLTAEEAAATEKALGCRLGDVLAGSSASFVLHEGAGEDGKPMRLAMVLTARARSEAMKILVLLTPEAKVESVELLSFAEPPQYKAGKKFMAQFEGMDADAPPRHGKNVRNVAGATITSRQTARAVHLAILLAKLHLEHSAHAPSP